MRKDVETLDLCDRFFDAIEQKNFEVLEACYAPETIVWHSHDCLYQSRASNLQMLHAGMQSHKRMHFANRRVRVFEGGFVQQHTLHLTQANGFEGKMDVCFIGYVRDGMLSRIYEYFDTGQRGKFLGPG